LFPSEEWGNAYVEALNSSADLARVGRGWSWQVLLVVDEIPEHLLRAPGTKRVGYLIDLNDGKCRSYKYLTDTESAKTPYRIAAPYEVWTRLIEGRGLTPDQAIYTAKIRVRGDLARISRFTEAAAVMVRLVRQVGASEPY